MGTSWARIPFARQVCDVKVVRCRMCILPCQEDRVQKKDIAKRKCYLLSNFVVVMSTVSGASHYYSTCRSGRRQRGFIWKGIVPI